MLRNLYTVIDQKAMSFGSHSGDMHSPTELFSIKGDKILRRGYRLNGSIVFHWINYRAVRFAVLRIGALEQ